MQFLKIIVLIFFINFIDKSFAQGLLNNGARIVFSGSPQLYIDGASNGDYTSQNGGLITPSSGSVILLEGDWNNNSNNTGFNADAGTVNMNDAAQNIQGNFGTTFYNLTLTGTGTKTLNHATNAITSVGGTTTTTGILSVGSQILDLNQRQLTITNPSTGGITYSTGFIQSEHQAPTNQSIVQWNVGTTTGNYIVPFGKAATQLPLTINITSGMGSATDNFQIATRATSASDNLPYSNGVTSITDPFLSGNIPVDAVIDRWWDFTWTNNATATLTFSYLGAFENTLSTTYNTGLVTAKYWDGSNWVPGLGMGSQLAATSGVGTETAPNMAFTGGAYTPMLLFAVPPLILPIELSSWSASCEESKVNVTWTMASEQNISHYTIQKSVDGITYSNVATINSSGNNSQNQTYNWIDPNSGTDALYRLLQTDNTGLEKTLGPVITSTCKNTASENYVSIFPNPNNGSGYLHIVSSERGSVGITVYDAKGALIKNEILSVEKGENQLPFLMEAAPGIYHVTVSFNGAVQHSRLIVQ
jgi:hypothetical protein